MLLPDICVAETRSQGRSPANQFRALEQNPSISARKHHLNEPPTGPIHAGGLLNRRCRASAFTSDDTPSRPPNSNRVRNLAACRSTFANCLAYERSRRESSEGESLTWSPSSPCLSEGTTPRGCFQLRRMERTLTDSVYFGVSIDAAGANDRSGVPHSH